MKEWKITHFRILRLLFCNQVLCLYLLVLASIKLICRIEPTMHEVLLKTHLAAKGLNNPFRKNSKRG